MKKAHLGSLLAALLCVPGDLAWAAPMASAAEASAPVTCAPRVSPELLGQLRARGLNGSDAAVLATRLSDEVGGRLTWSPNYDRATLWAKDVLEKAGLTDVRFEPIDEKGVSWKQGLTWMQLAGSDTAMVEVQAAPWSAPSKGVRQGQAVLVEIKSAADFDKYRGKLAGKLVLFGAPRVPAPSVTPWVVRLDTDEKAAASAAEIAAYYARRPTSYAARAETTRRTRQIAAFLTEQKPAAILFNSASLPGGGDTGLLYVENPALPGRGQGWQADKRLPFPNFVASPEAYNRLARLAQAGAKVAVRWQLDATVGAERTADNVVAEWRGTDPALAAQEVLIGAHLDSWASGTGAVDNGAGVAITIEAIRLLKAAGYQPRRTIRVVLYAGEEQGLHGAQAYARRHLGQVPRQTNDDQVLGEATVSRRLAAGPLQALPGWDKLAVAFNLDTGAGKVRGVFTGGGNAAFASQLTACLAPVRDLGAKHVFDQAFWPADQWVYSSLGLPTISFMQDPLDYDTRAHHTNMDTPERISGEDMAQATVVAATLIAQMASADEMPARPPRP